MIFLFKFVTCKIGPLSHLNVFHAFPRDSSRKAFTVMHTPVFAHSDNLHLLHYVDEMANNSAVAFLILFSI